jgi:hypothetical protein
VFVRNTYQLAIPSHIRSAPFQRPGRGIGCGGVSAAAGSAVEFEAWASVSKLSGMNTRSFVQKTTKNLQAMGTALTWIIEAIFAYTCCALNCLFIYLLVMRIC